MSRKETLTVWEKIPEDERREAVAAVPKYVAWLRERGERAPDVIHANRFLSKRRAEGFLAPAAVAASAAPPSLFAQVEGSGPLIAVTDQVTAIVLSGYWNQIHGVYARVDEQGATWLPQKWVEEFQAKRKSA